MKRLLCFILVICSLTGSAQQHGLYSQYLFNLFAVNPAYAGERDALSASLSYRNQWVGFEGAPVTQNFSLHSPIHAKNMALGLQFQNDEIGARKTPSFAIAYSYKIKLSSSQKLSFGLQAGVINYQYRWDELEYHQPDDPVAYGTDANKWVPNFDFGVMYIDPSTYFGLSATSLNQAEIIKSDFSEASLGTFFNLIGGKVFDINKDIALKPSFILRKGLDTPVQFDLNAGALFRNKFWLTTGYRYDFGLVFSGHFFATKHLHFGYSYDLPTNSLLAEQSGTHEFFIGYEFNVYRQETRNNRRF